jgi:antitoxin component of RelBE/YafQ-DinJ toxin-antitoxin module
MLKKTMYSFRIENELLNKTKKEANKLGISMSAFLRQAIIEKINNKDRLENIEERLVKLENLIHEEEN